MIKKGDATDSWNGRMKIIAHATVNDTTYAEGRFVTNMDFKDADSAGTSMDEIIVHHQLADKLGVTLGVRIFTLASPASTTMMNLMAPLLTMALIN